MIKKFSKLKIIVAALNILCILWIYIPVKKAVKNPEPTNKTAEFVICDAEYVTGFNWYALESSTGYSGYIFVDGVLSDFSDFKRDITASENKFVLYGAFDGEREFGGYEYPVFKATDWDILYPVRRNTPIEGILPKYGLCRYDFYNVSIVHNEI